MLIEQIIEFQLRGTGQSWASPQVSPQVRKSAISD